jgi:hypothetical protein
MATLGLSYRRKDVLTTHPIHTHMNDRQQIRIGKGNVGKQCLIDECDTNIVDGHCK